METQLMETRYSKYTNNIKETWVDRFTWKGLYGDTPKNSTTIVKFAKTGAFNNLKDVTDCISFKNEVDSLATKYVKWVKSIKGDDYTEVEYTDMYNFFIGAMGEYFFTYLLQEIRCITAPNLSDGKIGRYDFNYVAPRLKGEFDYGVDMTGVVSHGSNSVSCAIQVKFWNPFIEGIEFTNKTAQGVHSDAICNNFIDNKEEGNIIVCWLGNTNQVSKYLKANKHLYKHIVFIDSHALDNTINNQNKIFWRNLINNIKENIKDLK